MDDYDAVIDIKTIDDDTSQLVYNQMAWILATAKDENIRDLEKALIFAKKSVEINRNCRNLDTLAIILAGLGKNDEAIDTHKQAIELCNSNNPESIPDVEKHLKYYQLKRALIEECPGARQEMEQLRAWQGKRGRDHYVVGDVH